jgi:hypothetical protein
MGQWKNQIGYCLTEDGFAVGWMGEKMVTGIHTRIYDKNIQAALRRGCDKEEFIRLCHTYHADPGDSSQCGTCNLLRDVDVQEVRNERRKR